MVGRGGEQHPAELRVVGPGADGRGDAALGALRIAHLHELPEPPREDLHVLLGARQRPDGEAGRHARAVERERGQALVERVRPVVGIEHREQVGEARVHRQALAEPGSAVAGAELEPGAKWLVRNGASLDEADHRLRDHERQVALEAVAEPRTAQRQRVAERREIDPDFAVADLDREHAQLVGPLVERAARRDVEAGVAPVAREDASRERAAVEREAHVRAAVVDGADAVAVREQRQRVPVHVRDERSEAADVLEGGGAEHGSSLGAAARPAHRPSGRTSPRPLGLVEAPLLDVGDRLVTDPRAPR